MNIIERIESAMELYCKNKDAMHIPPRDTDIDVVLVDAMIKLKDMQQQIEELHASRENFLEYKNKIESGEFVLAPRKPNKEIRQALESGFEFDHSESNYDANCGYEAMIKAVEK